MNARRATGPLASSRCNAMSPAAAQVDAARPADERRELGQPAARLARLDRGELVANVVREAQSATPSSASSRRLYSTPQRAVAAEPGRGDDAMAGHDEREVVLGAEGAGRRGARGRPASAASSPYVTTSPQGTARSASASACWNGVPHSALELDVVEGRRALPRKYARTLSQRADARPLSPRRRACPRELVVEELPVPEVELPHSPGRHVVRDHVHAHSQ